MSRFFTCFLIFAFWSVPAAGQGIPDKGIWPKLEGDKSLRIPPWLAKRSATLTLDERTAIAILRLDGHPVKAWLTQDGRLSATTHGEIEKALGAVPPLRAAALQGPDRDADGIPDSLDVMIGARKTALNGAKYEEGFERLSFPGGDVNRERGVCTDVIVRAMRNAGHDLQPLIYRDMKRRRTSYGLGAGKSPNKHIEHRRVRRQIVWFKRHLRALPPAFDADAKGVNAWLPGDIVFMDTFPSKPGPDHVGIVSDQTTEDGTPLIINNWTYGYHTQDMDLLDSIPVTHRFRVGLGKKRK